MLTLIVDDEPAAARRLERLLQSAAPEAEVVARLGSVGEAVAWLERSQPPDLVFLDIELGDGLGFEIVERTAAADVAYAYRDGLVYLVTPSGDRFALDQSLDRVAERLPPPRFMRLDRRTLAAIDAVESVLTLPRSRLRVLLRPKAPFDPVVSQERAAEVKRWLGS